MDHLDQVGFDYTGNTTVFRWNYKHLPDLARFLATHRIYLHNFILMNAYYSWNRDGRAFGIQARYRDIYPYLKEAVEILESHCIGVNIRYGPLCSLKRLEKNLVGITGMRYDPYEWMNQAGHTGGSPVLPPKRPWTPSSVSRSLNSATTFPCPLRHNLMSCERLRIQRLQQISDPPARACALI